MYLAGNEGAPPREHLVRAVERCPRQVGPRRRRALDIGCGPGREALFLARHGFEVVAFDPYAEMLGRAADLFALEPDGAELVRAVQFEHATLERFAPTLEDAAFDLVHAGFVLPFVLPDRFDECFAHLVRCLKPGGIFSGQFFGRDDEFIRTAEPGTMSSHGREEIDALLAPFDILEIEEVNRAGRIGKGREKWWHVFHVTARLR